MFVYIKKLNSKKARCVETHSWTHSICGQKVGGTNGLLHTRRTDISTLSLNMSNNANKGLTTTILKQIFCYKELGSKTPINKDKNQTQTETAPKSIQSSLFENC